MLCFIHSLVTAKQSYIPKSSSCPYREEREISLFLVFKNSDNISQMHEAQMRRTRLRKAQSQFNNELESPNNELEREILLVNYIQL